MGVVVALGEGRQPGSFSTPILTLGPPSTLSGKPGTSACRPLGEAETYDRDGWFCARPLPDAGCIEADIVSETAHGPSPTLG